MLRTELKSLVAAHCRHSHDPARAAAVSQCISLRQAVCEILDDFRGDSRGCALVMKNHTTELNMQPISEQLADDHHDTNLSWSDIAPFVQALAFASAPLSEASLPVRTRLDLGPRGTMILNQIASGLVQPSEIALALNVGRSLVSADLARVEKAGLVVRKPGSDRRRAELALTKKGIEVMFEVKTNLEKLIHRRIGHHSKAEIASCTRLLSELQVPTLTK